MTAPPIEICTCDQNGSRDVKVNGVTDPGQGSVSDGVESRLLPRDEEGAGQGGEGCPGLDSISRESTYPDSGSPDGGWGWIVVGGCLVYFILAQGMSNSFGVYFIALKEIFGGSAAEIAWVNALYNTMRMVSGPGASVLCKRFGIRPVIIIGGLLMSAGCVISSRATSLLHLYISYGIITGIGGAMVYTPIFVAISLYFDKNKGKAMAIGTLGDGLGSLTMAPLARVLLDEYSFSGAILIIGGLMLHNCVVGALVRPLPPTTLVEVELPGRTLHNGDLHVDNKDAEAAPPHTHKVKLMAALQLLRTSSFLLYNFSILSLPYTGQLMYMALPSLAGERGLSRDQGALIVSLMGAGDIVGRFCFGFMYDLEVFRKRRSLLYGGFGLAIGFISLVFGVQTHIAGFITVGVVWGLLLGGYHGQRATIITDLVPKHMLPDSVGIMTFFQGLGSLSANTTGGLLADYFGTFSVCVYYGGAVTIVTSSLFLLDQIIHRYRRMRM